MRLAIPSSIALASAVALTTGMVHAADATPTGVEVGLRTGYAIPLGNTTGAPNGLSAPNLDDSINGVLPIWVDAGYRFNKNMYVGGYFQYGIGFVNTDKQDNCKQSGVSCTASDIMFGVDFHYHLMPDQTFDPWAGIGIGYEILNADISSGGQSGGTSLNGVQFFNVQVGGDYKALPNLGIGPFIMFGLGQFSNCSFSGAAASALGICSIPQTAIHEWFTFGVRGAYDINVGGG